MIISPHLVGCGMCVLGQALSQRNTNQYIPGDDIVRGKRRAGKCGEETTEKKEEKVRGHLRMGGVVGGYEAVLRCLHQRRHRILASIHRNMKVESGDHLHGGERDISD